MTSAAEVRTKNRLHGTSRPLVYEINTRILVNELSQAAGKKLTLATIPDKIIDEWADMGFDAVWLMGVWTTGRIGMQIAREFPVLQEEYRKVLPDFKETDVIGSPYAVKAYTVSRTLGGNEALLTLRKRLEKRGLGLVLDFVCNHTARDHAWVLRHPEYYVQGAPGDEIRQPDHYFATKTLRGEEVIAFGRDPTFPGWTDTAQLNHFHPALRRQLIQTLIKIAGLCDGVRCDMAMLILQSVFERTWGERAVPEGTKVAEGEFWKEAIEATRANHSAFLFIAEAYWDLEWRLQQLGFDFTYDKRLYDRLLREGASAVYDHLRGDIGFQQKSVRFIENHDEPRAARTLASPAWHYAAAAVIATVPGVVLIHEGQCEGRNVRVPVQLVRRPAEEPNEEIRLFYRKLLKCVSAPPFRTGSWRLLGVRPAWQDNQTWRNFLAFWWQDESGRARLVLVNYAPLYGQCYVPFSFEGREGSAIEFRDMLSGAAYVREKSALLAKGMYFDAPPYHVHIFSVSPSKPQSSG